MYVCEDVANTWTINDLLGTGLKFVKSSLLIWLLNPVSKMDRLFPSNI